MRTDERIRRIRFPARPTSREILPGEFVMRPLTATVALALIATIMTATSLPTAHAQGSKKPAPLPKPRPVKLPTKDGLELSGYYFGSNQEKAAIPVIIVHDWEGQKAPYGALCLMLQKAGCAVLAFDYRGHGGSREYTDRAGKTHELEPKTMGKREAAQVIQYDLESAKAFLKDENNEGRLNLNALVIIGVREGAVLGAAWAQRDWKFPSVGSRKQGQDVKGLVLISPERLAKGIPIDPVLADPQIANLPILVVYGEGSREQSDAERVVRRLEVAKKKLSGGRSPEGLEVLTVPQSLGGPALVTGSRQVIPAVVKFIVTNVKVGENDNPWIERQ
jgi:dienelactone hydrolase